MIDELIRRFMMPETWVFFFVALLLFWGLNKWMVKSTEMDP